MKLRRVLSVLLLSSLSLFGVAHSATADEVCRASWYGPKFHGRQMANGRIFNQNDASVVAHKSYPFGTQLRVTNLDNGRSLHVVVQDRGPYVHGRCVDLSRAAAIQLGFMQAGTARVRVQVL